MSNPVIKQITLPNGQIGVMVDDGRPDGKIQDISEIKYERSEIPQKLIDECEELSNDGETYFIFDNKVTTNIKSQYIHNKDEVRDFNLTEILSDEDDKYHIGTELYFRELPSRFSYYDTETKLTDRYDRYNYVLKFIKNLTFEPSKSNFGPEFEQSFILEILDSGEFHKYVIRVKPNLFISMIYWSQDGQVNLYDGFFKKSKMFESIERTCPFVYKSIIRDEKIKEILNEKEN